MVKCIILTLDMELHRRNISSWFSCNSEALLLQNYKKIMKRYFLCIIYIVMIVASQSVQLHYIRVNTFKTGNTLLCDWFFELAKCITMYVVPRKHFSKIFRNSEENVTSWGKVSALVRAVCVCVYVCVCIYRCVCIDVCVLWTI